MKNKKMILFISIIILLSLSLYHDLQKNATEFNSDTLNLKNNDTIIYFVRKKAQAGDTILSLVEQTNGNIMNDIPIENILNDFKRINSFPEEIELVQDQVYNVPIFNYKKRTEHNQP